MTTDLCWLPSTIMQTTGALLGIYAVVYVLTLDKLIKKTIIINIAFLIVVISSLITIFINLLWLEFLLTNECISIYNPQMRDFLSKMFYSEYFATRISTDSFCLTLLIIVGYTVISVWALNKELSSRKAND